MARSKKIGGLVNTDTGETLMEFFIPRAEDDPISTGLRILTRELQIKTDNDAGGGMGGCFGYGVNFENETFLMHPFCWCESETCPWCGGEDVERFGPSDYDRKTGYWNPPHFWFKSTDFRVKWYKYIGRDMASNREINWEDWVSALEVCLASIDAPTLNEAARTCQLAGAEYERRSLETMKRLSQIKLTDYSIPFDVALEQMREERKEKGKLNEP